MCFSFPISQYLFLISCLIFIHFQLTVIQCRKIWGVPHIANVECGNQIYDLLLENCENVSDISVSSEANGFGKIAI